MRRVFWMACAPVLLTVPWAEAPARAGDAVPDAVTLSQALDLVESKNPDSQAARLQIAQAEAARVLARQLPNPSLSTAVGNIALSQTQPPACRLGKPSRPGWPSLNP